MGDSVKFSTHIDVIYGEAYIPPLAMKLTVLFIFLFTPFSLAFASTEDVTGCEGSLSDGQLAAAGFSETKTRYGKRAFLGVQPEVTAETLDVAGKHGIIRWEQRFYIATTPEEAIEHVEKDNGLADKGLYFVSPENSKIVENADEFLALLDQGLMVIGEDGIEKDPIDKYETWKLLNHKSLSFHKVEDDLSYYSLEGWVLPLERTVISRRSVEEGEKTYGKRIIKFAKKMLKKNYSIFFNTDPETAMRLSRKYENAPVRKSEKVESTGSYLKNYLELFKQKRAFNVAVYAPASEVGLTYGEGGMIAGVIGHIQGKLYVIDSIFYPPIDGGRKYGEAAVYALLERLFEAGIDFVDSTKVSYLAINYLRAFRLHVDELMTRVSELPEAPDVNLDSSYVCRRDNCD